MGEMAVRQEQEPASDEVSELAPNVLRLQLPVWIPGLGHVNCYALADDRGAALVDPGLPGSGTWDALVKRLDQVGLAPRDIHTVVVTHSHPDHFGGAARFARESGAEVVAHRAFAFGPFQARHYHSEASVDDLSAHAQALEHQRLHPPRRVDGLWATLRRVSTPAPWKAHSERPSLRRRAMGVGLRLFGRGRFFPEVTRHLEHGDPLRLAGREWFALHTPGHTADHICLHDPETGVLLSGDHVLPSITPHIGGLSEGRDPLQSFFYSLDRIGEIRGVERVLPAHGHPFEDLAGRAEAIKSHHVERLEQVREIAREIGPADVEQFMQRLFRRRSWGEMAESETYAHLEHLRLGGKAEAHRQPGGRLIYEL